MKRLFKTLVYSTLALGTCSFTVASLVGEEPFAAPRKVTQLNRQGVGGASGRPIIMPSSRVQNPQNTLFGGTAASTSGNTQGGNTQGNTQGGNTQGNTQGSGSTAGGFNGSATSGGGGGLQAFGFGASGGYNLPQASVTPIGVMPNTMIGYIGGSGGGNFGGGFQGFAGTTGTQGGGVQGVQGIGMQQQQNGGNKGGMNGNLGI